jgi:hypothetical protein
MEQGTSFFFSVQKFMVHELFSLKTTPTLQISSSSQSVASKHSAELTTQGRGVSAEAFNGNKTHRRDIPQRALRQYFNDRDVLM